jgi:hypothetical protein
LVQGVLVVPPKNDDERLAVSNLELILSSSTAARSAAQVMGAFERPVPVVILCAAIAMATSTAVQALQNKSLLDRAKIAFFRSLFSEAVLEKEVKARWGDWMKSYPILYKLLELYLSHREIVLQSAVEAREFPAIGEVSLVAIHEGLCAHVDDEEGDDGKADVIAYAMGDGVVFGRMTHEQFKVSLARLYSQVGNEIVAEYEQRVAAASVETKAESVPVHQVRTNFDDLLS